MKISEFLSNISKDGTQMSCMVNNLEYTDMELDNLLPCPLCKHKAVLTIMSKNDGWCSYVTANVGCTKCHIQTRFRTIGGYYGDTDTIDDVINDWNNRDV